MCAFRYLSWASTSFAPPAGRGSSAAISWAAMRKTQGVPPGPSTHGTRDRAVGFDGAAVYGGGSYGSEAIVLVKLKWTGMGTTYGKRERGARGVRGGLNNF